MKSGNIFDSCPICGRGYSLFDRHKCEEKTLRGIDNAMKSEHYPTRTPSIEERLRDGFALMNESER